MRRMLGVLCAATLTIILSVAQANADTTHTVKNGESLTSIAKRHNTSVANIIKANRLDSPHRLKLGLKLRIPTASKSKSEAKSKSKNDAKGKSQSVKKRASEKPVKVVSKSKGKASKPAASKQASKGPISTPFAAMQKDRVVLRSKPEDGKRLTVLDRFTKVRLGEYKNGWYKIRTAQDAVGWVRADLLTSSKTGPAMKTAKAPSSKQAVKIAAKPKAAKQTVAAKPKAEKPKAATSKPTAVAQAPSRNWDRTKWTSQANSAKSKGKRAEASMEPTDNEIIRTAYSYRGIRYRYGGTSTKGFDCSGFTQHLFKRAGIRLPRTAAEQSTVGAKVERSDLQAGDLVFFHTVRGKRIGHVGIYIGNGKFIHASSGGGQVRVDTLTSGYYNNRFVTARRVKNASKQLKDQLKESTDAIKPDESSDGSNTEEE